jgi:hypothetical protein
MWGFSRVIVMSSAVVLLACRAAFAQEEVDGGSPDGQQESQVEQEAGVMPPSVDANVRRPFRGLFGADGHTTAAPQELTFTGSLAGAYDDNIALAVSGGLPDPTLARVGMYTDGNAGFEFASRARRSSFAAMGTTAFSYYPTYDDTVIASYAGGFGFAAPLGGRGTLQASQTVAYSPFYSFTVVPALPALLQSDVTLPELGRELEIGDFSTLVYETSVDVTHALSRRVAFVGSYTLRGSDLANESSDLRHQRIGGSIRRSLSPGLALRLGYEYRRGRYAVTSTDVAQLHDVDTGVNYGRSLSISRRTTLAFDTGSSILLRRREEAPGGSDPPQDLRYVFLSGKMSLQHELGRTWTAGLSLHRDLQYVEGFAEPFLSNAMTGGVSGHLNRRADVAVSGSYSKGLVGVSLANSDFSTTAVTSRARLAFTRHVAGYVEYFYYRYDFGTGVTIPAGIAREMNRQGGRLGVTTWLPVMRRRP